MTALDFVEEGLPLSFLSLLLSVTRNLVDSRHRTVACSRETFFYIISLYFHQSLVAFCLIWVKVRQEGRTLNFYEPPWIDYLKK